MLKYTLSLFSLLLTLSCTHTSSLQALTGKADIGASYMNVDIINNGSKVRSLSMGGISTNATLSVYKALVIKPTLLIAEGHGAYFQAGMNVGIYVPIKDCYSLTPSLGASHSWLSFKTDLPPTFFNLSQKFTTDVFNIALDGSWTVSPKLMLSGSVQYAWTESITKIGAFPDYKSASKGFNYICMIDYFLTECTSLNFAGALQRSRNKDRHGSDAAGFRIGLGYLLR